MAAAPESHALIQGRLRHIGLYCIGRRFVFGTRV